MRPAGVIDTKDTRALLFDLDGVVTRTAAVHARAWKRLFDEFLAARAARTGEVLAPFDIDRDYRTYVDGKARHDGVASFLASRGIALSLGSADDAITAETICGLGNRKNAYFRQELARGGVDVYEGAVALARAAKARGLRVAVVSASENCAEVLDAAGVSELFDARVDGLDIRERGLRGKPAPDTFLEAARRLGVEPRRAVVIEDAIAGVQAGRAGGFGLVIGVDRSSQRDALVRNGADVVVTDLTEIKLDDEGGHRVTGDAGLTGWTLVYETFDPAQERLREALSTLGNGYFATRGAAPESPAGRVHYPGTYIAGCYNRLATEVAGWRVEHEDLVNAPNWLPLTFRIEDGPWFSLEGVDVLSHRQVLDLRQGVLTREIRFRDEDGRTTRVHDRRLVHMAWPHLAALETTLTPEDWSGSLEFRTAIDGRVVNGLVERYRDLPNRHLEPVEAMPVGDDALFLKVQTSQSEIRIAEAVRTRVVVDGAPRALDRRTTSEDGYIAQAFTVEATAGTPVVVEKVLALYTSRDDAISECGLAARTAVAGAGDFAELLAAHALAWEHLWRSFDIEIEVDGDGTGANGALATATILRLHVFHLLQTVSPNTTDLDAGVPARGLHGEAYRGHVFWDELFIFPFLNLRMPAITRALLRYRYRRLDAARAAARAAGYRGAMFPWQSGSDGREETPEVFLNPRSGRWMRDETHLQRHVASAIAYNVWQYYQVTGDLKFLADYGAEMFLEIARFWASAASYDASLDRWELRGVVGPDEYHDREPGADRPGLANNAYTTVMAAWVLGRAAEVLDLVPADERVQLAERLALTADELRTWDRISRRLRLVFHDDGILSQFEGYGALEELDWEGYRKRYGHLYRLDFILEAEGDTTNRYKLSKQADVLMLFYLLSAEELRARFERLGYPVTADTIPRTVDYYLRRSAHDSTLSRVTDSWVLARSDRRRSWDVFMQALVSDVADIQGGTTAEGIHLGAMAGTLDVLQRCYTGLELRGDVLWLDPRLPESVRRLRLFARYRGHSLELTIGRDSVRVSAERCAAPTMKIGIRDRVYELAASEVKEFPL